MYHGESLVWWASENQRWDRVLMPGEVGVPAWLAAPMVNLSLCFKCLVIMFQIMNHGWSSLCIVTVDYNNHTFVLHVYHSYSYWREVNPLTSAHHLSAYQGRDTRQVTTLDHLTHLSFHQVTDRLQWNLLPGSRSDVWDFLQPLCYLHITKLHM